MSMSWFKKLLGPEKLKDEQATQQAKGFAAGTLVHTDQGLVSIEQLKVGDNVLSRDADGSGEVIYKAITQIMINDNVLVGFIELSEEIDNSLPIQERLRLQRIVNSQEPTRIIVTKSYPFFVAEKGWPAVEQVSRGDIFIDKDGVHYSADSGNDSYSRSVLSRMYKTDHLNVGFVPDSDEDNPARYGSLIDLTTGKEIENSVSYKSVLNKLYEYDSEWKNRLLAQIPEDQREHAEFHGFRQGHWVVPETVQWGEGEGPVTLTVYNIEVADTHTYYVGYTGIWVHDLSECQDGVRDIAAVRP